MARLTKFFAVCLLVSQVGCVKLFWGDAYEAACVKGQLSADQARVINVQEWKKKPGYCAGQRIHHKGTGEVSEGQVHCDAEEYDRILAAHCSYVPKILKKGD